MRLFSLFLLLVGACYGQGTAEIEKTIQDELSLLVEQKLDKPGLAKHLKLQYPITEPTMTEADIQARINVALKQEMAKHRERSPEEIETAARKRYPLFKVGDEVAIRNRRGQTLRGTLRENTVRFVKIDDRLYSKVDLSEESLLAIDEERNAAMVKRYISNQINIQLDRAKNTRAVLEDSLGRKLRLEAGYARYRGRWMTAQALFDRALAWKRGQLAQQYRPEVEARVYTRFGYSREEGKWIPPADAVAAALVATDQQDDFFSQPAAPLEAPPPSDEPPPEAPELPSEQPKVRDTVLNALKEQGAVEHLPPSAAESAEPPEASKPTVSEAEIPTFEDKSEGAAPVDFSGSIESPDAQVAALHSRIDALRPEANGGGGAFGGLMLALAAALALAATGTGKYYFANTMSRFDLFSIKL
jgi:hypothetical protein